jgi:hypothetical protein
MDCLEYIGLEVERGRQWLPGLLQRLAVAVTVQTDCGLGFDACINPNFTDF